MSTMRHRKTVGSRQIGKTGTHVGPGSTLINLLAAAIAFIDCDEE